MTKFLVTCNNPRIASTKTQSIFCNKTSFAKDRIQKRWKFHDIKFKISEFSWDKNLFQKLLNLWKQAKGRKISNKLSRKRWQVINFSPLSSQNSSQNVLKLKLFSRFYIWYFETNISFQNSNTQTSFLKAPTMIKHES